MADIQLLTQADFVLNKCGRPTVNLPSGVSVVYIPKGFLLQQVFAAGATTPVQTVTKEITGDTIWCLRSLQISSEAVPVTAISLQALLPNGRFLFSNLTDALQVAGYGSYRFLFTKELQCPPGSKISVTFQATDTTSQQPIAMLFGGDYAYLLKNGSSQVCGVDEAAALAPRYFGDANQNIFAPCWQQGVGPATPQGLVDEEFTYAAPAATAIDVTAANVTAVQQIGMEAGSEFHVRRVLVQTKEDDTVTSGTILMRIRDGSGYAFTEDYIDAARYIGSCPLPHDWIINPTDSVYIDAQLVDQAGAGNISYKVFLEGFKRRIAG